MDIPPSCTTDMLWNLLVHFQWAVIIIIIHGAGGFFLACKGLGRMFDHTFPACAFLLFFSPLEGGISLQTHIPLFTPGSVHSGALSWDDYHHTWYNNNEDCSKYLLFSTLQAWTIPKNIHEVRSLRLKARNSSVGYSADDKISTCSLPFLLPPILFLI